MKLHVTIEKDEAGYYVAEVPALPGCLSQGKTCETLGTWKLWDVVARVYLNMFPFRVETYIFP